MRSGLPVFTFAFCLFTFAFTAALALLVYVALLSRHKKTSSRPLRLVGRAASVERPLSPEGFVMVDGRRAGPPPSWHAVGVLPGSAAPAAWNPPRRGTRSAFKSGGKHGGS